MTNRKPSRTTRTRNAHAWKPKFLAAFTETRSVTVACKTVGIGRSTAYDARQADEDFALAWADVEGQMIDEMEREAYRRAVEGITKPLVSAGKYVTDVQEYSDGLLMFLLKARRPAMYRERVEHEHTGRVKHKVELPDEDDWHSAVAQVLAETGAYGPRPDQD